MSLDKIPQALKEMPNWVLWKHITRDDKPTKVPFQANGQPAKANDPQTWADYATVAAEFASGNYAGLGYEFAKEDPFCGVDLDGCRDPETGIVADWARDVLRLLGSYSEVSPSKTGVKIFIRAKSPFEKGRKRELDFPPVSTKTPAIEIYDWGRYFAVTGWRLGGLPNEPVDRQSELNQLIEEYFPNDPTGTPGQPAPDFRSDDAIFERARKYIAKLPAAVSGQDGHGRTFHAACVLVLGFELSEAQAMALMNEYNRSCSPPWSEKELLHKVKCAAKQTGQRGYLKNANPDNWSAIGVPTYQEPAVKHEARETTLLDATLAYVEQIRAGVNPTIGIGIPDLDYALFGGVEKGEFVILAARPSHGKSMVGLQAVHYWTSLGMPCAIISEEMAALALGKRTLQFVSDIPQEHWSDLLPSVTEQIAEYGRTHAKCVVLEGCGTAQVAREAIERAVAEHGVQCVVVDYAQLLGAPGKGRYEQMTNMSVTLRQLASSQKIILLALCQMSRDIETRNTFEPQLKDLKETGQLEQDADVIVFLCWPYRIDESQPLNKFQFFVRKNRNRGINGGGNVVCRIVPHRQQILDPVPEHNHVSERERADYR